MTLICHLHWKNLINKNWIKFRHNKWSCCMRYPQLIFFREREWGKNSCRCKQGGGCVNFAIFEQKLWRVDKFLLELFLVLHTCKNMFSVSRKKFTLNWRIYYLAFLLTVPSKQVHAQSQHQKCLNHVWDMFKFKNKGSGHGSLVFFCQLWTYFPPSFIVDLEEVNCFPVNCVIDLYLHESRKTLISTIIFVSFELILHLVLVCLLFILSMYLLSNRMKICKNKLTGKLRISYFTLFYC